MKKVLITIIVILIIVVVTLTVMAVVKSNKENQEEQAIGPSTPEQIAKIRVQEEIYTVPEDLPEDVFRIGNQGGIEAHYSFDITDNGIIGNMADYIIIGTVENIEGGINHNPTTGYYSVANTVGTVKVEKVLKGKIKEDTIPFIKTGGYIPFSEYKKELPESLRENQIFEEMPQDDEYILQLSSDDILIEQGKTYYMLLKYDTDFERYNIDFMQYGLREVDTSNGLNLEDNSKIQVKDNANGNYSSLSSILSTIENSK